MDSILVGGKTSETGDVCTCECACPDTCACDVPEMQLSNMDTRHDSNALNGAQLGFANNTCGCYCICGSPQGFFGGAATVNATAHQ
jgi:hypothetical protein